MTNQYKLPFGQRQGELLATIAGLRDVPLMVDGQVLTPGRINGVVELLQRIVLFARDFGDGEVTTQAQVIALAAKIEKRPTVSERTVRRWSQDAQAVGLLRVDALAAMYGYRHWNRWTLDRSRLVELTRPQVGGRTWPDMAGQNVSPKKGCFKVSVNADPDPERSGSASAEEEIPFEDLANGWPELDEFAGRTVTPLSARLMRDGVYRPLQLLHLEQTGQMVVWHRSQLSAPRPVLGESMVEVAFTVAAAMQAAKLPDRLVEQSRVGLFVGIVQRRAWRRVFRHLASAIEAIDGMGEAWPLVGEAPDAESRNSKGA